MQTVTSADGTTIAYDRAGSGPAIVFLPGAFNDRTTCAALAGQLQDRYTVICYDRRGRGDSTDAIRPADVASYQIRREVEDLDAVIAAAGGEAAVFGYSSGANLALHAAVAGSRISRLALYEAPLALGELTAGRADFPEHLAALIADGRPEDAVATMQIEGIGLPADLVDSFRQTPMWARLVAIAQTVVYDAAITRAPNIPTTEMTELDTPAVVLNGAESWSGLRTSAAALSKQLRNAQYNEVPGGADHGIPAEATAAVLDTFLRS